MLKSEECKALSGWYDGEMEDIAEELARRDRFLRHRRMAMTPEQRMAEMQRLQDRAFDPFETIAKGIRPFHGSKFQKALG